MDRGIPDNDDVEITRLPSDRARPALSGLLVVRRRCELGPTPPSQTRDRARLSRVFWPRTSMVAAPRIAGGQAAAVGWTRSSEFNLTRRESSCARPRRRGIETFGNRHTRPQARCGAHRNDRGDDEESTTMPRQVRLLSASSVYRVAGRGGSLRLDQLLHRADERVDFTVVPDDGHHANAGPVVPNREDGAGQPRAMMQCLPEGRDL